MAPRRLWMAIIMLYLSRLPSASCWQTAPPPGLCTSDSRLRDVHEASGQMPKHAESIRKHLDSGAVREHLQAEANRNPILHS